MDKIDWHKITHFKPSEFPSKQEISNTDPKVFQTLDNLRAELNYPIYPSPAKGALARDYGNPSSQHYCINRLSTAVDIFPACSPLTSWIAALHHFSGVGVYFDTYYRGRKWVMLHCDLRPNQTLWYRESGLYANLVNEQGYKLLVRKLTND